MGDNSAIEWCDASWPIVTGCTRVSAGCEHCYAEKLSSRLEAMGQAAYAGLTRRLPNGEVRWSGVVRCLPERLIWPLKWRKPRRIFVTSMADLFHEAVPDSFIDQVFAVMAWAEQHTFQVLTKRPERMRAYLTAPDREHRINDAMCGHCIGQAGRLCGWGNDDCQLEGESVPLPNVWLGTSVEDQETANERIPHLLRTPAAVRFLSCEPLLGPLALDLALRGHCPEHDFESGFCAHDQCDSVQRLHWVIAGGESGPNHRPMDLQWARDLRDQCQAAGVAYFFKQVGGRTPGAGGRLLDGRTWDEFPRVREAVAV